MKIPTPKLKNLSSMIKSKGKQKWSTLPKPSTKTIAQGLYLINIWKSIYKGLS